jgi:hypothetical protein
MRGSLSYGQRCLGHDRERLLIHNDRRRLHAWLTVHVELEPERVMVRSRPWSGLTLALTCLESLDLPLGPSRELGLAEFPKRAQV